MNSLHTRTGRTFGTNSARVDRWAVPADKRSRRARWYNEASRISQNVCITLGATAAAAPAIINLVSSYAKPNAFLSPPSRRRSLICASKIEKRRRGTRKGSFFQRATATFNAARIRVRSSIELN